MFSVARIHPMSGSWTHSSLYGIWSAPDSNGWSSNCWSFFCWQPFSSYLYTRPLAGSWRRSWELEMFRVQFTLRVCVRDGILFRNASFLYSVQRLENQPIQLWLHLVAHVSYIWGLDKLYQGGPNSGIGSEKFDNSDQHSLPISIDIRGIKLRVNFSNSSQLRNSFHKSIRYRTCSTNQIVNGHSSDETYLFWIISKS